MGKYILGKIGVAFSTSIVLGILIILWGYNQHSKQSFLDLLLSNIIFYIVYSLPVILISGVPVSMLIDKFIRIKNSKIVFILKTIIYGLSGGLIFLILLIILSSGKIFTQYLDDIDFTLIGIVAAILFYWIETLFRLILHVGRRLRNS